MAAPNTNFATRVKRWKRRLVDRSRRNRALNFRPRKWLTVELAGQPLEHIAAQVLTGDRLSLRPAHEEAPPETGSSWTPQPADAPTGAAALQTIHPADNLDQRLLKIHREMDEKLQAEGVNSLFLTLGMLEWFEDSNSDEPSLAPLWMIPVKIARKNARSPFYLEWAGDDPVVNPSLAARCRTDFDVSLPEWRQDMSLRECFEEVQRAMDGLDRWRITADGTLGFFGFKNFLIFQEFERYEQLYADHPIVAKLTGSGSDPTLTLPQEVLKSDLNESMAPWKTVQPLDADSSQLRAMLAVREGHDIVIEGPPGTGKSQTITNLIADQLSLGRTVLFVAEKDAALNVVHQRLTSVGLGDYCLDLHGDTATKPDFTRQLRQALNFDEPPPTPDDQSMAKLERITDQLQGYVEAQHEPLQPLGWSPFEALGEIARLQEQPTIWAPIDDILTIDRDRFDAARDAVGDLADAVEAVGSPLDHPMRGVALTKVTPQVQRRIAGLARDAAEALGEAQRARHDLTGKLGLPADADPLGPAHSAHVQALASLARLASDARPLPDALMVGGEVRVSPEQAQRAVALVGEWDEVDQTLDRARRRGLLVYLLLWITVAGAWMRHRRLSSQIEEATAQATGAEASWWRALRAAPEHAHDNLAWIDAWRRAWHSAGLVQHDQLGARLRDITPLPHDHPRRNDLRNLADQVDQSLQRARQALLDLSEVAALDLVESGVSLDHHALDQVQSNLETWRAHLGDLPAWSRYLAARARCRDTTAASFSANVPGDLAPSQYQDAFVKAFAETWLSAANDSRPALQNFHGDLHDRRIASFWNLEERAKDLAVQRTRAVLDEKRRSVGDKDLVEQLRLIKRQAQKKSRIMPLRKIFARAPDVLQRLLPCMLMSPASVARYTNPERFNVDLVIFDEASQIRPAEAVGSIVRGRQLVVVGDSKQLPPTAFFGGRVDDLDELRENELEHLEDLESILDELRAADVPSIRLKWHYRSQHESLIRFSNEEFYYDDPLYTFPSAAINDPQLGLSFEYVPDVVYKGKGRNLVEARRVAEAVVDHIRQTPERTLGVGTFNINQREFILDMLDEQRRANPDIEWFFSRTGEQKFFVKNLENIQGDDRDVIFISVGYGPDANGKVRRNFGAINKTDGWRRLNVLTTRAKQQLKVFSAMRADDISIDGISDGANLLRKYLKYAETGEYPTSKLSQGGVESPFEAAVKRAVEALGFRVVSQVGEAGYRVDLGIIDPNAPGRYLCGIECDGATYHSALTVRDRDRTRQAVLEARGWRIYRIWSTDWFRDSRSVLEDFKAWIAA